MSLLSTDSQQQVEDILVKDNYLDKEKLDKLKAKATEENVPFLSYIISDGGVSQEVLTKISAHINHLPYVNLSNSYIDPKVLGLLPQDTAEQYMAVPLGEMQQASCSGRGLLEAAGCSSRHGLQVRRCRLPLKALCRHGRSRTISHATVPPLPKPSASATTYA